MRVAILGAGGVGGYYGGVLAERGHDVRLFARGGHLDALRERGLELRAPEGARRVPLLATDDPAGLGGAELAIVAVKAYSLPEIGAVVERLAADGAAVLPLLNGVDAADRLAVLGVPRDRILGGLTYISAARVAPGVVERRSPFQRVIVGELDGALSPRAERVAAAFADAGVEARATGAVEVELWRKFIFLAAVSAACGLARAPIGPLRASPLGPALLDRAVREVAAVGRARGVRLDVGEEEATLALIDSLPPAMKPSFLLDLEAGGPTELDVLSGAVARLGREVGVATPVHETAAAALAVPRAVPAP